MTMRRTTSLQGRLVALVLSAVLLIWLVLAATVWLDAPHELDELLDGHLAQAAALLVAQQPAEGGSGGQPIDAPPCIATPTRSSSRFSMRVNCCNARPMHRRCR